MSTVITSICSSSKSIDTLANPSTNIYEQTPKRTIRGNSVILRKRKELLDKSPARKRLNSSGLSSTRNFSSVSDIINTAE